MNRIVTVQAIILRTGFWLVAAVLSLLFASVLVAPVSAAPFGTAVMDHSQFLNAAGTFDLGSNVLDSSAGLIIRPNTRRHGAVNSRPTYKSHHTTGATGSSRGAAYPSDRVRGLSYTACRYVWHHSHILMA